MSTLTKERLLKIQQWCETYGPGSNVVLPAEEAEVLARIALASLEAEAVGWVSLGEYDDCGCHPDARVVCIAADGQADWENFKDGTRLYTAPPSLVVIDERAAFNAWNNDENLPIAGVGAKNAAWLAWQARSKLTAPLAPVSVPEPIKRNDADGWWMYKGRRVGGGCAEWYNLALDDCRAAMLQGAGGNSPDGWVACSERMPDPDSAFRVCAYTPTPHEDVRFRFVPASLFKSVCRDATHWQYMLPPAAPQQEDL